MRNFLTIMAFLALGPIASADVAAWVDGTKGSLESPLGITHFIETTDGQKIPLTPSSGAEVPDCADGSYQIVGSFGHIQAIVLDYVCRD